MMIPKLLWTIQMIFFTNEMFTKILKNINPGKRRKILKVFDDMIADIINNTKTKSCSD